MAGRRQHYIPRFLQRGFLGEGKEGAERTWLHRRGVSARLVGIRDVGVGEYFYSKLSRDGAPTLDDLLTTLELEFEPQLKRLCQLPDNSNVDPKTAARLTVHLTLRTAHIRSSFELGASRIVDYVGVLVGDPSAMRKQLQIDADGLTDFRRQLALEIKNMGVAAIDVPEPLLQRMLAYMVRENFEKFLETASPILTSAVTELRDGLASAVQEAHNKSLASAEQTFWEVGLAELTWKIQKVEGAILADCVALAFDRSGTASPLLLMERSAIDAVVLPLTHDRLLVGYSEIQPIISVEEINHASALCSNSFFIARHPQSGQALSEVIGRRAEVIINGAVQDAIGNNTAASGTIASFPDASRPSGKRSSSISFTVSCVDFADKDLAKGIAEVIGAIVGEMSRQMPLARLEGFTLAVDYPSALSRLDPGDPNLELEASAPPDYGHAVAKCVTVIREGKSKEHIVMQADVAVGLVSKDHDLRALSTHMVTTMVAKAAHVVIAEAELTQSDQAATDINRLNQFIHPSISGAPSRFFSARASAFADHRAGERFADLVITSLDSAKVAIGAARMQYRKDGDIEALFRTALRHVTFVIDHAAEWLGHRDGLPAEDNFPGNSLVASLNSEGLGNWFELLGQDLALLYSEQGQFTHANIIALDRHVERLLWSMYVCPWIMPNEQLFVSVPMGEDEQLLSASGHSAL